MWQRFFFTDTRGKHSSFVYLPQTASAISALPLIVMLHGCTQTALDFARGTSMNLLAERHGFAVLYPQQTSLSNYKRCWNWFLPMHQQRGRGEPARIVGMIQSLRQHITPRRIDPARMYVAGLSAGACMASILGATYPDLFAAIGVHSGLEYQAATNVKSAFTAMERGGPDPLVQGQAAYTVMGDFARVVPSIIFQGANDATVAPVNGNQVVRQWLQTNQLASNESSLAHFEHPTQMSTGQSATGHTYTVASWHTSNGDKVQEYWKISSMGHAWSGGDPSGSYTDARGPDASTAMHAFFMAHPMRREERQKVLLQRMRQQHVHNSTPGF